RARGVGVAEEVAGRRREPVANRAPPATPLEWYTADRRRGRGELVAALLGRVARAVRHEDDLVRERDAREGVRVFVHDGGDVVGLIVDGEHDRDEVMAHYSASRTWRLSHRPSAVATAPTSAGAEMPWR